VTGGVANRVPGAAPWLRLSPQAALAWSVLFAFSLLWSAVELSLRGPWLGITWVPDEGALRVERVDPDGPARGALAAGDRIVGLERDGQQIPLDSELLLDDPDIYSTFAEYDRFFARQGALYALVAAGRTVTLIHAGGRPTTITPLPSRPLRGLPAQFWFLTLFGVLVWQVGAGMWAYRREQVTGLVALTGFAAAARTCARLAAGSSARAIALAGRTSGARAEHGRPVGRAVVLLAAERTTPERATQTEDHEHGNPVRALHVLRLLPARAERALLCTVQRSTRPLASARRTRSLNGPFG